MVFHLRKLWRHIGWRRVLARIARVIALWSQGERISVCPGRDPCEGPGSGRPSRPPTWLVDAAPGRIRPLSARARVKARGPARSTDDDDGRVGDVEDAGAFDGVFQGAVGGRSPGRRPSTAPASSTGGTARALASMRSVRVERPQGTERHPTPLEPTPTASGRGRERPPIAPGFGSAAGAPYDFRGGRSLPRLTHGTGPVSAGRVAPLGRRPSKSGRKPRGLGPNTAGPG